jgi:hypothetical protein
VQQLIGSNIVFLVSSLRGFFDFSQLFFMRNTSGRENLTGEIVLLGHYNNLDSVSNANNASSSSCDVLADYLNA